jgi:type VI secretion system secreted protein VgrG
MIFNLTSSAIPPNAKVAGFRGSERLSKPYVFDVYFTVDSIPGMPIQFDLSDAVYAKAKLSIKLGQTPEFFFHGVLATVRLVRAADSASLFHARLVPQLWQLTLTKHSRIWTHKSSVEVIQEVLEEAGIEHEFRTNASYPVEEHITQYKESNLAFISRWMEREGMYYFFEQTDDGDLLVITDQKSVHESLRTSPVKYWPQSDYEDVMVKQAFDNFAAAHNALPASVKLIDYNYAMPLLEVSATVSVEQNAVGEIAEYGGRFFTPADAQRLATVRAEELLANKDVFEATGAATSLSAGFTFTLEDHPLFQYNTSYLATSVEHHGYDAQFGPAWGSLIVHKYTDVYRVELVAISTETQYRPGQQTPWPRVDGYENAVVDGPATSQYAQIDDQGRYQVKFKFDEGTLKDGKGSTFVRMAQPHGGPQEGHHFPLRKGVEVICSFLGGDPDRPVITGVVHNMLNQSVVTQNNYTKNILRTGSLNHIVIEDLAGSMFIDVFCPIFSSTLFLGFGDWNFNLTTQGCGQIQTTLNLNIDVDQWWTTDVVNYVRWDFHNTHTWNNTLAVDWTFSNTFTWEVTSDVDIKWLATLNHLIRGAATIQFDATVDLKVAADVTAKLDANVDVDIAANLDVAIQGNEKQLVSGNRERTVNGNEKIEILGNQDVHVVGTQKITVDSPEEKHWLSNKFDFTAGMDTSIFAGIKNELSLAMTNSLFVGVKNSFQLAVLNEITVAMKMALTLGFQFDFFGGARVGICAGTNVGINATTIGINGLAVGMNVVNVGIKPAVDIQIGGPEIHIKVIELHI